MPNKKEKLPHVPVTPALAATLPTDPNPNIEDGDLQASGQSNRQADTAAPLASPSATDEQTGRQTDRQPHVPRRAP
jgi:hypothetical protein